MKIVRCFLLGSILLCTCFTKVSAQPWNSIKWTHSDSGIYMINDNSIDLFSLPSFEKTVLIDSQLLIPTGKLIPLAVRDFSFSEDKKTILIYTNSKKVWRRDTRGDYWILNLQDKNLQQLGKGLPSSSLMFAKISPDNKKVAYVSAHNIYMEDLSTHKITPITKDGTARLINGTFDWAYEEEFGCRDGFRWSTDSKHIAYWQIDASKIRNFLLINNTDSVYSFVVPVEYPKAGEDPSPCKVGVADITTQQTKWMNVPGDSRQHYIPRMEWAANNTALIIEQLNRKQNEAKIFQCAIHTGISSAIYTEKNNTWIDTKERWNDDPAGWEWINGGKDFLWVTEKDGWRHIYKISRDGKKETLLTKGNYDIISIEAIDEKKGYVYFMASPTNATQQYLYKVSLKEESALELVSPADQKGTHEYSVSPHALFALHSFSNANDPGFSEWVNMANSESLRKNSATSSRDKTAPPVEMFQVTTADNVTMDGWMIKPKNFDSSKKYPVVFQVYTEPGATTVKDAFKSVGTPLYAGDMAKDGYIQISLDGRGTPAPKGADWRKAIYRKIGIINIRDQAMAAQKIMLWKWVDTSRIAVYGWSGGGSTTLNLLFQYPEIYKTGIAIAPVANFLLYDNIYQERYLGLPQENRQDYINGSPLSHVSNLKGNLLVIHGTGDDNVHYQGTEMLINELVKYDKSFQMMSYPNRTHSLREGEGTTQHLHHLFTSYLQEHCPGGGR
jgi:dipeptidyl-peptidase-4